MNFVPFFFFISLPTPTMNHNVDDASFLQDLPFSVLQAFRDQVNESRHCLTDSDTSFT